MKSSYNLLAKLMGPAQSGITKCTINLSFFFSFFHFFFFFNQYKFLIVAVFLSVCLSLVQS